jgi:hypothetical protein
MPNQPATPNRVIRVPDDRWRRFGELTDAAGTDRSKAVNAFVAWYCLEPGAELPERPGTKKDPA